MNKFENKYRITDIQPKNGVKPVHYDIKNSICYPAYLLPGERGLMLVETSDWVTPVHRFQTSVVENVTYTPTEITIETKNTIYVLRVID